VARCTGCSFLIVGGQRGAIHHHTKRTVVIAIHPVRPLVTPLLQRHDELLFDRVRPGGANMTRAQAKDMEKIVTDNSVKLTQVADEVTRWYQDQLGAVSVPLAVRKLRSIFFDTGARLRSSGLEYIGGPTDLKDAQLAPLGIRSFASRLENAPVAVKQAVSASCIMSDAAFAATIKGLCGTVGEDEEAAAEEAGASTSATTSAASPVAVPSIVAAAMATAAKMGIEKMDAGTHLAEKSKGKTFGSLAGSAPFWDLIDASLWHAHGVEPQQKKVTEQSRQGKPDMVKLQLKIDGHNFQHALTKSVAHTADNHALLREQFWGKIIDQMKKEVPHRHPVFRHQRVIEAMDKIMAFAPT